MAADQDGQRNVFESTIQAMEAEIANVGARLAIDGATREAYASQIRAMAEELRVDFFW